MSLHDEDETKTVTERRPRRELRADLVRYLPSQIIPAAIGFLTIPVVTRLFDPTAYGDYRLVLATVGVFGAAAAWVASSIYRFYPEMERKGEVATFQSTVSRLLLLTLLTFGSIWVVGLLAVYRNLSGSLAWLFVLGLFLMLTNIVWSVANGLVRALREVTWYSLTASLNKALTLGIGVGLVVWFGFGADGLIYGSIAASILLLPLLLRVIRSRTPERRGEFDRRLGTAMLRYGYPIALMQLAAWVLQLSDRYMIAWLRDTHEVGLYTAAYGIAEQTMQLILVTFQLPFAVLGSRVWERDGPEEAARFVSSSAHAYLLVAIPAWAGITLLAGPIMNIMTDTAYHQAASIMPAVAAALLIGGIHWWYTSGPTFVKRTGQTAIAVAVAGVVNIVLNLVLVGRFGYQVAATTTLVAYGAGALTMIWLSRRHFRWKFPVRGTIRAFLAAGVMAGAIFFIRDLVNPGPMIELVISVPGGAVVYGVALLILGEPEAKKVASRLMRRFR